MLMCSTAHPPARPRTCSLVGLSEASCGACAPKGTTNMAGSLLTTSALSGASSTRPAWGGAWGGVEEAGGQGGFGCVTECVTSTLFSASSTRLRGKGHGEGLGGQAG